MMRRAPEASASLALMLSLPLLLPLIQLAPETELGAGLELESGLALAFAGAFRLSGPDCCESIVSTEAERLVSVLEIGPVTEPTENERSERGDDNDADDANDRGDESGRLNGTVRVSVLVVVETAVIGGGAGPVPRAP